MKCFNFDITVSFPITSEILRNNHENTLPQAREKITDEKSQSNIPEHVKTQQPEGKFAFRFQPRPEKKFENTYCCK